MANVPTPLPKFKEIDSSGNPAAGYLVYSFIAGTTTKVPTYTDYTEITSNTNPIVLDARGEADIWLSPNGSVKLVFTSPDDNLPLNDPYPGSPIWTVDNLNGGTQFTTSTITGNTSLTSSDNGRILLVDATAGNVTITPQAASTAGSSYIVYLKKSDLTANTVTFDPPGGGTVDGQSTFVLVNTNQSASFFSNGSAWYTLNSSVSNTSVLDSNANTVIATSASTNPAGNLITAKAGTTGVNPSLSATGGDSNITLKLKGKGTGGVLITDGSDNALITATSTATTIAQATTISSGATIQTSDARTNTVARPVTVYAATSGTPAAGIGTGTLYQAKSGTGVANNVGAVQFAYSDVTASSEDSYFSILLRRAGAALSECFRFTSTGLYRQTHVFAGTANRTVTWPDADINLGTTSSVLQRGYVANTTMSTGSTAMPYDDTIPQITEGVQALTLTFTPSSSSSYLSFDILVNVSNSTAAYMGIALFDGSSNAIAASYFTSITPGLYNNPAVLRYTMANSSTSPVTYSVRVGSGSGGTLTINGNNGSRIYGGVMISSMTILEYTT